MHDEPKNSKSHPDDVGRLRVVVTRGASTFQHQFSDETYALLLDLVEEHHAHIIRDGQTLRVIIVGLAPWLWGCA
jgi:hypothetical protein